jgi:hypothetical protein
LSHLPNRSRRPRALGAEEVAYGSAATAPARGPLDLGKTCTASGWALVQKLCIVQRTTERRIPGAPGIQEPLSPQSFDRQQRAGTEHDVPCQIRFGSRERIGQVPRGDVLVEASASTCSS